MSLYNIGGFPTLDWELHGSYYKNDFLDNFLTSFCGRSALKSIIGILGIKILNIPYYYCPEVTQFLKQYVEVKQYHISDFFLPTKNFPKNEHVLGVNYFGICDFQMERLYNEYGNKLIVDNCHSLFSQRKNYVWFSSLRKWYGVPDGAIIFINEVSNKFHDNYFDTVGTETNHLFQSACGSKNLEKFRTNEAIISALCDFNTCISGISAEIVSCLDLEKDKICRRDNFNILNKRLDKFNNLNQGPFVHIDSSFPTPFCYPFLNKGLPREEFVKAGIWCPKYWDIKDDLNEFETNLTNNLACLPINYTIREKQLSQIIGFINEKIHLPT